MAVENGNTYADVTPSAQPCLLGIKDALSLPSLSLSRFVSVSLSFPLALPFSVPVLSVCVQPSLPPFLCFYLPLALPFSLPVLSLRPPIPLTSLSSIPLASSLPPNPSLSRVLSVTAGKVEVLLLSR